MNNYQFIDLAAIPIKHFCYGMRVLRDIMSDLRAVKILEYLYFVKQGKSKSSQFWKSCTGIENDDKAQVYISQRTKLLRRMYGLVIDCDLSKRGQKFMDLICEFSRRMGRSLLSLYAIDPSKYSMPADDLYYIAGRTILFGVFWKDASGIRAQVLLSLLTFFKILSIDDTPEDEKEYLRALKLRLEDAGSIFSVFDLRDLSKILWNILNILHYERGYGEWLSPLGSIKSPSEPSPIRRILERYYWEGFSSELQAILDGFLRYKDGYPYTRYSEVTSIELRHIILPLIVKDTLFEPTDIFVSLANLIYRIGELFKEVIEEMVQIPPSTGTELFESVRNALIQCGMTGDLGALSNAIVAIKKVISEGNLRQKLSLGSAIIDGVLEGARHISIEEEFKLEAIEQDIASAIINRKVDEVIELFKQLKNESDIKIARIIYRVMQHLARVRGDEQ